MYLNECGHTQGDRYTKFNTYRSLPIMTSRLKSLNGIKAPAHSYATDAVVCIYSPVFLTFSAWAQSPNSPHLSQFTPVDGQIIIQLRTKGLTWLSCSIDFKKCIHLDPIICDKIINHHLGITLLMLNMALPVQRCDNSNQKSFLRTAYLRNLHI